MDFKTEKQLRQELCNAWNLVDAYKNAVPKWQPIETAPRDGTEFVAAYAHQGFVKQLVYFSQLHEIWKSKDEWIPEFEANATHWMPLPEPPTEEM